MYNTRRYLEALYLSDSAISFKISLYNELELTIYNSRDSDPFYEVESTITLTKEEAIRIKKYLTKIIKKL